MKVLVTGVTGFTGGRLAAILAEKGILVRGLVRAGRSTEDLERRGVEIATGDLRDPEAVAAAARGVDTIYHVAATYRQGGVSRHEYFDINVGGTRHVLEAARREGIQRVLHVSTVGVQGHIESPPATEDHPFAPGDTYQESKLDGERLALEYGREHGVPVTVVRPVGIYGPGDTRFLKLFRGIAKRRFVMIGSGKALYHLTYVDDLCRGMFLAATSEKSVGRIYTIGGPPAIALWDFVRMIADAVGVKPPGLRVPFAPVYLASILCEGVWKFLPGDPPLYRRRVDFFRKDRSFDITRARKELGYRPLVPPEEGLAWTAAAYRAEGLLPPLSGDSPRPPTGEVGTENTIVGESASAPWAGPR